MLCSVLRFQAEPSGRSFLKAKISWQPGLPNLGEGVAFFCFFEKLQRKICFVLPVHSVCRSKNNIILEVLNF